MNQLLLDVLEGAPEFRVGGLSIAGGEERIVASGSHVLDDLERLVLERIAPARMPWPGESELLLAYLALTGRVEPLRGTEFLAGLTPAIRRKAQLAAELIYGPWRFYKHPFRLPVNAEIVGFAKGSLESSDSVEREGGSWLLQGWETGDHPEWKADRDRLRVARAPVWTTADVGLKALLEDILRARRPPVTGFVDDGHDSEIVELGAVAIPVLEELLDSRVDRSREHPQGAGDLIVAYVALTATSAPTRGVTFLSQRSPRFTAWALSQTQHVFGPWLFRRPDYGLPLSSEYLEFAVERSKNGTADEAQVAARLVSLWKGRK